MAHKRGFGMIAFEVHKQP